MISVKEATERIQSTARDYGTESIPLSASVGRVLRENLYADRPFPPFNRVTMDGIAIQHAAFANGQRDFHVEGVAPAGASQMKLQNGKNCLEVMTGAILPENTDTVIRYEDTELFEGKMTLQIDELKFEKNVHKLGSDRQKEDLLIEAGRVISSAEIGVAATVGKTHLQVSKYPKTIIISTGDELVEVNENPLPYQIRKSNVHLLQSMFTRIGMPAKITHLKDDYNTVMTGLSSVLNEYDLIVLSGGVSAGKFDYLPKALNELKVTEHFHKVRQRPGKPLWFGESPKGTVIFALPGNPVSSFSCAQKYIFPWLQKSLSLPLSAPVYAALSQDYTFKPDLTYFLQVKISYTEHGQIVATPFTGNGSGDLANLTNADGFLELPKGKEVFKEGEVFSFVSYRS
ncbi:MAG: molybdopterin molybdotransferase [Saprospiraceae bacterium]|jgi:molybdopterin molybdotransferase